MGIPSIPPMPHSPSVVISNPVTEAPIRGPALIWVADTPIL